MSEAAKARPAWWLLAICALGMLTVGVIIWSAVAVSADPGFNYNPAVKPYIISLSITPDSDAARAGLRNGDLVDLRLLAPAARYRLMTGGFVIGERLIIPVLRSGRTLRFELTPTHPAALTWDAGLAFAGNFWVLVFAAIIAWRRPRDAEARTLSLFLSTLILGITLSYAAWQTPSPVADAWVTAISFVFYFG
ncbi:MAG: hypothetical protein JO092_11495, partial [Candidatus Eremiobacteraeota bacterium]|nr:hypothetical protein [Candidatus Eremiobacteraeota bacterium]